MSATQRILWSYVWLMVGATLMGVGVFIIDVTDVHGYVLLFLGILLGASFFGATLVAGDWIVRKREEDGETQVSNGKTQRPSPDALP